MVARYQEFVDGVVARGELDSAEEARAGTIRVVEALAERVGERERELLAERLPGKIRDSIRWDERTGHGEPDTFLEDVAVRTERPAEHTRYLVMAVLSELTSQDSELAESLSNRLPAEVTELFSSPGGRPPPERGTAGVGDRPRPLEADELERALTGLDDWAGDTGRITRTVVLPSDRWPPLLRRVEAVQQELSHHAKVDRGSNDDLTFSVRTRSVEAVTELDLELARRIDEAVAQVSSGG
ncbi:pterin-4a-carbinolamine dehydratase/uncharacterized protein (DUF2267 family) [Actinopolyspora biskrensis]|uniref:Putative pterin-4-alpha-carbinolamine dehydratase n=1 Tax=Actinopolyspora biskrensis TaxID=1470178 RepID=A0A852YRG3_9ACTN|nr:DUF2267 domain-containing protein [Actinopolyspora biskrensis]NYH77824.1 pterin-4a-carbinolamine dehydratase/uncharacterized protein (DUF2267 family) [Actinopolyspora biskrensis]